MEPYTIWRRADAPLFLNNDQKGEYLLTPIVELRARFAIDNAKEEQKCLLTRMRYKSLKTHFLRDLRRSSCE